MRKVIEHTLVSLDGVFEDPPRWCTAYRDDASMQDGLAQLLACDAVLLGRRTYDSFARIWPNRTDPWADRLNAMQKYVFSSTLDSADWNNTTIVSGDVAVEVTKLKQREGRDLVTYGHGLLAKTLPKHHLLDVLELLIHPVVVGDGEQFFRQGQNVTMRLVTVKTFPKGTVKLTYETQYAENQFAEARARLEGA